MKNNYRGDIVAVLDNRSFTLRLTLGSLVELENSFNVDNLISLSERFETGKLSSKDILKIIACGLRGGGTDIGDEDVAKMSCDGGLKGYVDIAAQLLEATFGVISEKKNVMTNPIVPQNMTC